MARLDHHNIARVHDFIEEGSDGFLVMEFVDGANLASLLFKEDRLALSSVFSIMTQICAALEHAHALGVIHRDIKPSNILVRSDGVVKLIDFGIAKMSGRKHGPDEPATATGDFLGTPPYMAPEQCRDGCHVDHRADIYALGAIFYEMLTGELPHGRFPLPSRLRPEVPRWIDRVVVTALASDPEDRFQSVAELHQAVEEGGGDRWKLMAWCVTPCLVALTLCLAFGESLKRRDVAEGNASRSESGELRGDHLGRGARSE